MDQDPEGPSLELLHVSRPEDSPERQKKVSGQEAHKRSIGNCCYRVSGPGFIAAGFLHQLLKGVRMS